jgi:transcriptional regulator with XRE-family HTH domain
MEIIFKTDREILQQIVQKLKVRRKQLKFNQKELAVKAGVSFRTVQKLEGDGNVTMLNFMAIVRALGAIGLWDSFIKEEAPSPREIHLKKKRS